MTPYIIIGSIVFVLVIALVFAFRALGRAADSVAERESKRHIKDNA